MELETLQAGNYAYEVEFVVIRSVSYFGNEEVRCFRLTKKVPISARAGKDVTRLGSQHMVNRAVADRRDDIIDTFKPKVRRRGALGDR